MALVRKVTKTWGFEDVRQACRLYLVTDNQWLDGRTLHACVAEAIVGGASFVQLRDKGASTIQLVRQARMLAPVCRVANVPLVIDDDVEAAKTAGVDGVHVGQSDAACAYARRELGPNAIVGVSVQTVEQALSAEADGASYLGVGAMFATATKTDAELVSLETLRRICEAVSIPVVAIGGLNAGNVADLAGSGVDGIAVVSAILAAPDIEKAASALADEVDACILHC